MRNKLPVMIITFLVLIAITPFIFSKLMNAKFNQMLNKLRSQGYKITEIKNKSSYLTTDRVFLVTIPKEKLANFATIAKSATLKVETLFKNLPVTDVKFLGSVDHIEFNDKMDEINSFLKKDFKFIVTTPNFKTYQYKIFDINTKNVKLTRAKGVFEYSNENKNRFSFDDFKVDLNGLGIEVKNYKSLSEFNNKKSYTTSDFNFYLSTRRYTLNIQKIHLITDTKINKKIDSFLKFSVDKITAPNIFEAEKLNFYLSFNNINKAVLNTQNQNELVNRLFEKGFNSQLKSSLKNIKVLSVSKDLGGFDIDFVFNSKPVKNVEEKLKNNDLSFIDAKLNYTSSPEIANIIMQIYPKSAFLFALAQKKNGLVKLNLEFKNSKLYSEGQPVQ